MTWSNKLVEERIVAPEDRVGFDQRFTAAQRQKATPGLKLIRALLLEEARALDGEDRFDREIATAGGRQ
jgi:hypothetical protein